MQTAKNEARKERYATRQTLECLDWTTSGIAGTGDLSPRTRRLLQLFVSLSKLSYCGLIAPLGALSDTLRRCLDGGACSIRTIQRAAAELSDKNFVFIYQKRQNFCRIMFNPAAFAYWTGARKTNVIPISTIQHKNLHTPNCRTEDRTSITPGVNLRNSSVNIQEQRAGARASYIHSKTRRNPVIFSMLCVLRKAKELHVSDRRLARLRAQCEVDALAAGIDLVNPSGVDWDYWAARWDEMSVPVKEATFRREILPNLIRQDLEIAEQMPISDHSPSPVTETDDPVTPTTAEDIRKFLINLEKSSVKILEHSAKASTCRLSAESLSAEDFAILDAARRRIKCGGAP